MNAKIDAINSLVVEDDSCSGGECEYVLVLDTPENRKVLLDAGFTEDDLDNQAVKPDPDDDVLEVSYLAWIAGADLYCPSDGGFVQESGMRISREDGDDE